MHQRVVAALLSICLMACPVSEPRAATVALLPQPERATAAATPGNEQVASELMAQVAGALIGYGLYFVFLTPPAAAATDTTGLLGYRLLASGLAGTGAIAGTYAYDVASGLPLDYAYFWHRGGFIAGVAAGAVVFATLGFPAGAGTTWLGWTANRAALVGAGLLAAWATDSWYRGR